MSNTNPKYTRLKDLYENQIEISDDYRNTINVLQKMVDIKNCEIEKLKEEINNLKS